MQSLRNKACKLEHLTAIIAINAVYCIHCNQIKFIYGSTCFTTSLFNFFNTFIIYILFFIKNEKAIHTFCFYKQYLHHCNAFFFNFAGCFESKTVVYRESKDMSKMRLVKLLLCCYMLNLMCCTHKLAFKPKCCVILVIL